MLRGPLHWTLHCDELLVFPLAYYAWLQPPCMVHGRKFPGPRASYLSGKPNARYPSVPPSFSPISSISFTWIQESTEEPGEFGPPQQHHIIHPSTHLLPSRRVCGAEWMAPKTVGQWIILLYTLGYNKCIPIWSFSNEGATLTSATAPSTSINLQLVRRRHWNRLICRIKSSLAQTDELSR